jgi:nitrate reductase NapE component
VEQQVASKKDFAALFTQVGLPPAEAKAAAREHWRRRPGDAGTTVARPDESRPRGTTMRQQFGTFLVIAIILFLLFLLVFLVFVVAIVFGGPLPGGD